VSEAINPRPIEQRRIQMRAALESLGIPWSDQFEDIDIKMGNRRPLGVVIYRNLKPSEFTTLAAAIESAASPAGRPLIDVLAPEGAS
jgi:hypothetical protein